MAVRVDGALVPEPDGWQHLGTRTESVLMPPAGNERGLEAQECGAVDATKAVRSMGRRRNVVALVLAGIWLAGGCLSTASHTGLSYKSRAEFDAEWSRYLALAPSKAVAVAGDVEGSRAVGYAHGYANESLASAAAIARCEAQRTERRLAAPCEVYAVGDTPLALIGGEGEDHLVGGPGADRLIGLGGADKLEGGPGADRFVFREAHLDVGVDALVDFRPEEGDRLVFEGFDLKFDLSNLRIEGATLLVRPKSLKAWAPVADLGRADLTVEVLARKNAIQFGVVARF